MWGIARKKPIEVRFREVVPDTLGGFEYIPTREGTICGYKGKDYIIMGVEGELYPIKKDIFEKTYDVVESIVTHETRKEGS